MAYLHNIIEQLENTLHVQIHGSYHSRAKIESVLFWTSSQYQIKGDSSKILYLCDASNFTGAPANGYLLIVNYPNFDLPVHCLCIPQEVDICDVLNIAQTAVLEHHLLKLKEEELFQTLHQNTGIAGLVNIAYTHLGNPINICDTSFTVIASSPKSNDIRNLEEKDGRLYLKDTKFQNMIDQELIKKIYSTTAPFMTYVEDYPYQWIFRSIRIRHSVVGYICVRAIQQDFKEEDFDYIDMLSHILSIELQRNIGLGQPGGLMNYDYFLTELLDGHFARTDYITNHMIQLEREPKNYYFLLILDNPANHTPELSLKNYDSQILSILPNCMPGFYHNKLTILLPSSRLTPFTSKEESRLLTFLQFHQIYAYISYPYEEISESHNYYRQVDFLSSLSPETLGTPEDRFVYYKNHFIKHTFELCGDFSLLKTTIHPHVRHLIAYDRTHHTEYATTLFTYITNNRNAMDTANALHIHKSTFFYRLNKMTELFELDLSQDKLMFAYEYSFLLIQFLKSK